MDLDEALERSQWDLFWLPPGVRVVDRPELMYLAAPGSRDGYLNAVLRVRAGARLDALVGEVLEAHRGVASRWMLAGESRGAPLERALAAHGYACTHAHDGYAIAPSAHVARPAPGVTARAVSSLDELRGALEVMSRAFGRPFTADAARLAQDLAACTREGARVHRFVAWDDATGAPLATGSMNAYPELGLGFLWGGGTVPEARGRGAYSALVAARAARARALGLRHLGLYARKDTSAPIVAAQGFTRLGPMDYWERPEPG